MSDLATPPYAGYVAYWVHVNQELDAIGSGVRVVWANVKPNWVRVRDRAGFSNQRITRAVWDSLPKTEAVAGVPFLQVIKAIYPQREGVCHAGSCRV